MALVQLTIDVTKDELDLILKRCWLRPLKKAYDILEAAGTPENPEPTEHAFFEIEPLFMTEQIRNKLVEAYFKQAGK